jgi:hypothetical protein
LIVLVPSTYQRADDSDEDEQDDQRSDDDQDLAEQ